MYREIQALSTLISSLVPKIAGNGHPSTHREALTIASAAYQLYTLTMPPKAIIHGLACAHSKSASLRACVQFNVAEHLREAGPKGLSASELGKMCNTDGAKLARCIRSLSNVHVFKELKPNVFTNNSLSSELDTGRATADIAADPITKHDGTNGFPAFMELHSSISGRSSGYIYENLADAGTALSDSPMHSTFARAFLANAFSDSDVSAKLKESSASEAESAVAAKPETTSLNLFQWLNRSENEYNRRMFGMAMAGVNILGRDGLFEEYDWDSLPKDSVVVDVGGGFGVVIKSILENHPRLKIVIQDLPNIVREAEKLWERDSPDALTSGRVVLEAHDFFTPQPHHSASVFIVSNIIHNWSPARNKVMLTQLAQASTPQTRLLVATNIITHTCKDDAMEEMNDIGAGFTEAPEPLLPNYGAANELGIAMDIAMMNFCNTQEYTIQELADLLAAGGWRIERVYRNNRPDNFSDLIQCVPL